MYGLTIIHSNLVMERTLACLLGEIKATIPMMLTSSFIFLQGVGPITERRWWQQGVVEWHHFLNHPTIAGLSATRKSWYDDELRRAQSEVERGDFLACAQRLPRREQWRLYDLCRPRICYLDIETTGLSAEQGDVTVVGLHRNGMTTCFVRGENLTADRLQEELDHCDLLVTFFGSVFDVPYLSATFPGLRFPSLHFDLCFAARRLGLQGGLKSIEAMLGIERDPEIRGLDGWAAVQLWADWRRGQTAARERLLTYNRADTEHLVPVADHLYEQLVTRFGPAATSLPIHQPRQVS